MKILLTGAAGFIGSHTAEKLLSRGDEVVGLDDFNDYYSPVIKRRNVAIAQSLHGYNLIEGDIRDAALVEKLFRNNKFDKVIHLAARAGVRPSLVNPALYESANVQGLLNLLEASVHNNQPDFIFASSSSVYGISPRLPWREDDAVDCPISPYAITKRTGELLCHNYHKNYGLRTCSLRFFTVYGPRQRPEMAIAKFFNAMLEGYPIRIFGDGSAHRDFTYVEDIVEGLVSAADHGFANEIINLGGSRTVTILELIDKIGQIVGKVPTLLFEAAERGDVPSTWADSSRAQALLGQTPATSLENGLKQYYDWLLSQPQMATFSVDRQFNQAG